MMKHVLTCGFLLSLAACGGETGGSSSSSSNSSSSSSSASSSSSSSSSTSSSSSSSGGGEVGALTNVEWELRYLEDELGVRTSSSASFTLNFDEDAQVGGSTPCGEFASGYTVRHEAMRLTQPLPLPEGCPRLPWLSAERNFYVTLNEVVAYAVDESALTLQSINKTKMVFETVAAKCASPKAITGERPATPVSTGVNLLLASDLPLDEFINRLETEYADLELLLGAECRQQEVGVIVNRVTLEHLRCRDDITEISYF